jgi:hypothetical protein
VRHRFGGDIASWVFTVSGSAPVLAPGVDVTFWSAPTGGAQFGGLSSDAGGSDSFSSVQTGDGVNAGQIPVFYGPDGVTWMWASAAGHARVLLMANDLGDQFSTIAANAQAAADSVGDKAADSTVVHRTAVDETVAGVKTFSSLPVIPATTPTVAGHVASKAYVDGAVASRPAMYVATDPQWGYTGSASEIAAYCQAAISAMPSTGGTLYIPAGSWTFAVPLVLKSGVTVRGAGSGGATTITAAAAAFNWTASINNVVIEDMAIVASAGHIFSSTNGSGIYLTRFRNLKLVQSGTGFSIMSHTSVGDYDRVLVENCHMIRAGAATVPGWYVRNTGGAANCNVWRNLRADSNMCTSSPFFYLESYDTSSRYANDNRFEDVLSEGSPGGVVHAYSVKNLHLSNVVDWDTSTTQTGDVVRVGRSTQTGSQASRNVFISGCGVRGISGFAYGTSPATYDVNLVPGDVKIATVVTLNNNGVSGKVNFAAADTVNILGAPTGVADLAWSGQPAGVTNFLAGTQFANEAVMNVKDYGVKGDGSTETTAIQAVLDAAPFGGKVYFPRGIYQFSTLTIQKGQTLVGDNWFHQRTATTTFGDTAYSTASFFDGTLLRSTATSGAAIVHRGGGAGSGTGKFGGALRDLMLIGPGTGTAVGIQIGQSTPSVVSVLKSVYDNVKVVNFATGVLMQHVNECSFRDLTIQGCTKGASLVTDVNNCIFDNLNMQYCTDGVAFEDSSSVVAQFNAPICQNVSGVGLAIQGEDHQIFSPYFEGCPTIASFTNAQLCGFYHPTVQGSGLKTLTIGAGSNNNTFWGLKAAVGNFVVTNNGSNNIFQGILGSAIGGTGSNPWLFDTNGGALSVRNFIAPSTVGPSFQAGSALGFRYGGAGSSDWTGAVSPEGAITAVAGSTYRRTDGAGPAYYVKTSLTGNTGWVPVGASSDIKTFSASGTWTKPAGATSVTVTCIAGGGGGGSGACGDAGTARTGGAGGAGGSMSTQTFPASLLTGTVAVTVGAGGTGGASVSTTATGGNLGGSGGHSSFGGYLRALNNSANGGSGGSASGAAASAGGNAGGQFPGGAGAASAAAGGSGVQPGVLPSGAGGGSSGGGITTGNVAGAGAAGRQPAATQTSAGSAGTAPGGAGGAGSDAPVDLPIPGSGGASGAGGDASTAGGAGAGGSKYGAGGGGGGASQTGLASGKGGDGAGGIVQIIAYFS